MYRFVMMFLVFALPLFSVEIPKEAKIFVAGHRGLVGSALIRKLKSEGYLKILTVGRDELDLRDQAATLAFFEEERPDYVFLAAAKVGGIKANRDQKADFIYDNLIIEANVIHSSYLTGVTKLLFLGSSCIYPKMAAQPMRENYLMSGPLELTNDAYAIAKIAGIYLCKSYNQQYKTRFISCMPTNLYGPNDNYDLESSHVLPALVRKFVEAKLKGADSVELWGTGCAFREFLHVDDMADACLFLMNYYEEDETVNIGYGKDITIMDLALTVKEAVGFKGNIVFDITMPDGTPKKLLDTSKINALGWKPKITLYDGIKNTIADFIKKSGCKDYRAY